MKVDEKSVITAESKEYEHSKGSEYDHVS